MTMAEWYELAEIYLAKQGIAGTSITEDKLEQLKKWKQEVKRKRNVDT